MWAWTHEWPARLYVAAEYTAAYISSSGRAQSSAGYVIGPIRRGVEKEALPSSQLRAERRAGPFCFCPYAAQNIYSSPHNTRYLRGDWNVLCGYKVSVVLTLGFQWLFKSCSLNNIAFDMLRGTYTYIYLFIFFLNTELCVGMWVRRMCNRGNLSVWHDEVCLLAWSTPAVRTSRVEDVVA